MTLLDLLDSGITIEGPCKVQCWENECYPTVYYEGDNFPVVRNEEFEQYHNREVIYMFPFMVNNYLAGICIELSEPMEKAY